ncbi:AB hydrolase-1 domain-containing protein [Aphelenchoides bicaudatus]|nr:AB hydrolase-1 domain-containing protein [Aphelenchoides bicaudatus]
MAFSKLRSQFQLFAFWTLVCFWSLITILRLLSSWLRNFGNYFYVLNHKKPAIKENWTHGRIKVSNDVQLHYVESGNRNGKLLLFVHGFCDFFYGWRNQLDYFGSQNNYRVIAIDLRGYNDSSKPDLVDSYKIEHFVSDLKEVILKLGKGKAVLVGDDIGALFCWLLAEECPELLDRLVILNCPVPRAYLHLVCSNSRQLVSAWRWFALQTPYLNEIGYQAQDYDGIVKLFKKPLKNKQNFNDTDAEYYKFVFSKKHGLTAPLQFFRAIPRLFDNFKFNGGLIKPKTLILWGASNDSLVIDGAYHSRAYCEQAELKVLPNGRHLQIDEPQIVNQLIDEFLKKS